MVKSALSDGAATILLVEDDQRMREAMVRALVTHGHVVRGDATGADALRDIVDWQPDVVVLDLGLPDIDGEVLLPMLRAVSEVPVVVATVRDDEADIIRLLDAGADDYVTKPFSGDQLDAQVRAVLRRADVQRSTTCSPSAISASTRRGGATLAGEPLDLRARSSTCSPTLPDTRAKWSPSANCWPACGTSPTRRRQDDRRASSWLRRELGETADSSLSAAVEAWG